jgi:arsenate reductase (thioredoxin)
MIIQAKSILFICIGNACRSQMAEGFARHYGGDKILAFSAGSRPAGFVAPLAIEVMKEKGIDITRHHSKAISELPRQSFDYVVTMGCGDECPWVKGKLHLDWQIADPIGRPIEFFRQVRDEIEEKVKELVSGI